MELTAGIHQAFKIHLRAVENGANNGVVVVELGVGRNDNPRLALAGMPFSVGSRGTDHRRQCQDPRPDRRRLVAHFHTLAHARLHCALPPPVARALSHARRSHLLMRARRRRSTCAGRGAGPWRRASRATRTKHRRRLALELVCARGEEGPDRLCILRLSEFLNEIMPLSASAPSTTMALNRSGLLSAVV